MTMLGTGTASSMELLDNAKQDFCKRNPEAQGCATGSVGTASAVPEIDASSGSQAIALAVGLLLLGAERLRRRASEK
jgi:hypothetical protein